MGLFVSFEGIDRCGKTVQIKLLEDFLNKKDKDYIQITAPGGTEISDNISSILFNKESKNINEYTEATLFLAMMNQNVSEKIKEALKKNKIVIADRYIDSIIAYQGYGKGANLEKLKRLCEETGKIIAPDITFLLKISPSESLKRLDDKYGKAGNKLEGNDYYKFLQKVDRGYRELAKENRNRIIIIDASKSAAEIHEEIVKYIKDRRR